MNNKIIKLICISASFCILLACSKTSNQESSVKPQQIKHSELPAAHVIVTEESKH